MGIPQEEFARRLGTSATVGPPLGARPLQALPPRPPPVMGPALIDTGATVSAVDQSVVQKLGLQPVGLASIGTAGGQHQKPTYPGRFIFPGTGLNAIDFAQLVEVDLAGQRIPGSHHPLIALTGRNVLQRGVFVYNGSPGTYTLAF